MTAARFVEARGLLALRDEPRVRTVSGMKLVASRGLLGVRLRWGGIVPGSETSTTGRAIDDERD